MRARRSLAPILNGRLEGRRIEVSRSVAPALWIAAVLAGAASAQNQPSDILLNVFDGAARIERIHADGTPVWTSTGGTGQSWEGCALTQSGHVVTTRRSPGAGINVFDQNGVQIGTFLTPQVGTVPGDVSIFSDGTLAVASQGGTVHLFTEAGVFVSNFTPPGVLHPFGSYIDLHDQLFLCDISAVAPAVGQIHEISRSGQLLARIPLNFIPGDLAVAGDGTLWVTDRNNLKLKHLDIAGTVLIEFPVNVSGLCSGLALAADGTLYTTGETSSQILHYSNTGQLLGSIPIPGNGGTPLFLTVEGCGLAPGTYCAAKLNSIGCLPAIDWIGVPSASSSSGFSVRATNVRNQKAGLLIYSVSGRNNVPFQGGILCVLPPVRRTSGVNSGGSPLPASDCSGVYTIDMNAFAHGLLGGSPLSALTNSGTLVDCQWWGRDPGFSPPNNSTLSEGLEYSICP